MQLLPTTDLTKAHSEFAAARLNGSSSGNNGSGSNSGNGNGNGSGGKSAAVSIYGQTTQLLVLGALLFGSFIVLA
jgi:hypothetical protein